jgi:hypothetical protein
MANPDSSPNYQNSPSPLDGLRLISYCPLCNAHYNPREAKILEQKEGAHLIHVECRSCRSSIVAVVITGGIGVSSVGLITDLTSQDVIRFKNEESVAENDVIAAYEVLSRPHDLRSLLV